MKKLIFMIILSVIAFKLKAQQKLNPIPFEKLSAPGFYPKFDTIALNLPVKPKNDLNLLFSAQQKKPFSGILYASVDHMPIVKPVGKWNMPVVKPDGTVIFTTPIKHLPPVIKTDSAVLKPQP